MQYKDAFFALVRAGLFPVHGEGLMVHDFSNVDWGEVYRLAEEQSVIGLIADAIDRFKFQVSGFKIPQEWALQFIGQTLQIEQRNKAMNEFVARLISLLRKNDIYAILVKGQGIAQCYEKPLWRASGDVDLLLSEDNYEKAKEILIPLALTVDREFTSFKHLGMRMEGDFEVELHGTMRSRLSKRIDRGIDEVQNDVFYGGSVRSWQNGSTQVFLPAPDEDVIFVFTHILHHFFIEGVGLRQICDWCRLLWTYKDKIDVALLEKRLRKMDLMSEWKAFAALAVNTLGMPESAMPLYDPASKWSRKAEKILAFVLETGNFGHNRHRERPNSYIAKKAQSLWRHTKDNLRQMAIFPLDSLRVWWGVFTNGLYEAVRGK